MDSKKIIWVGMFLGSFVGEIIPSLWGAGSFSFSSIILSAVGAVVGIWIAFKISRGY